MAREFPPTNSSQIENLVTLFKGLDIELVSDPLSGSYHPEILSDSNTWFTIDSNSSLVEKIRDIDTAGYIRVQGRTRPDLISFDVYGDPLLSHIIMLYNDIVDFRQIVPGDIIYFPAINDVITVLINK